MISIQNQGTVPKEVRDNLFDRYVSQKKGGTGLGTYSARLIAKAHGGDISFTTSDTEDRTIFKVTLNPKRAVSS